MQDAELVEMGRRERSGTVLRDAHSVLRPSAMGVGIGAIAGSTGRTRQGGELLGKDAHAEPDQRGLRVGGKKTVVGRKIGSQYS